MRPPASRNRTWTREEALVELIRGRMTLAGPTTARALAASVATVRKDCETLARGSESTATVPPCDSTIEYVIDSPNPVPAPGSLVVKNGVNRCGTTSSGIPAPESATRTCTRSSDQVATEIAGGRTGRGRHS